MNDEVHIRDLLEGTLDKVSQYAMCGDNGSTIVFGIPTHSTCKRCRERWQEETGKDPVKHKFRLKMHGVINGGYSLD